MLRSLVLLLLLLFVCADGVIPRRRLGLGPALGNLLFRPLRVEEEKEAVSGVIG